MVKDNGVIPRHSPKLGTSQGDANTDDVLLLRWRWWDNFEWGQVTLQHLAKPVVLLLKYVHFHPQDSILIAKLISDTKSVFVTSQILKLRKTQFYQTQNSEPTKNFLKCFTDDCVLLPIAVLILCGLDCDVDHVVLVACEVNSSAVPNTKIKPTGHKFGM